MMMTSDEAIVLANEYVAAKAGPNPQFAKEPCEYRLIKAHYNAPKGTWDVFYQIYILGNSPGIVQGPVIVIVDPASREVSFFV